MLIVSRINMNCVLLMCSCIAKYSCLPGSNPCTAANLAANNIYFAYSGATNKYIVCGPLVNQCTIMPCAPGTVWSQALKVCVTAK